MTQGGGEGLAHGIFIYCNVLSTWDTIEKCIYRFEGVEFACFRCCFFFLLNSSQWEEEWKKQWDSGGTYRGTKYYKRNKNWKGPPKTQMYISYGAVVPETTIKILSPIHARVARDRCSRGGGERGTLNINVSYYTTWRYPRICGYNGWSNLNESPVRFNSISSNTSPLSPKCSLSRFCALGWRKKMEKVHYSHTQLSLH